MCDIWACRRLHNYYCDCWLKPCCHSLMYCSYYPYSFLFRPLKKLISEAAFLLTLLCLPTVINCSKLRYGVLGVTVIAYRYNQSINTGGI